MCFEIFRSLLLCPFDSFRTTSTPVVKPLNSGEAVASPDSPVPPPLLYSILTLSFLCFFSSPGTLSSSGVSCMASEDAVGCWNPLAVHNSLGPFTNYVTHLGGRGSAKR